MTISSYVFTVAGAVGAKLVADEVKAWCPAIAKRLTQRAVNKLPEEYRDRLAEEWQSHLNDIPGDFGKVFYAIDLLRASRIIRGSLKTIVKQALRLFYARTRASKPEISVEELVRLIEEWKQNNRLKQ